MTRIVAHLVIQISTRENRQWGGYKSIDCKNVSGRAMKTALIITHVVPRPHHRSGVAWSRTGLVRCFGAGEDLNLDSRDVEQACRMEARDTCTAQCGLVSPY